MAQEATITRDYAHPRLPKWAQKFGYPLPPLRGAQDEPDDDVEPDDEPDDDVEPDDESDDESGKDPRVKRANKDAERYRRELRTTQQELEQVRGQLQQHEDANKSEIEKATDRAASAERDRDAARSELTRLRIARKHGLPDEAADRLKGQTEEELEADAKEFAQLVKTDERPRTPKVPGGPQGEPGSKKKLTFEQVAKLAREDPDKFNAMLDAGEIPAEALGA